MSSSDVVKWKIKHKYSVKPQKLHLHNYWTPLSGQVEEPESLPPPTHPPTPETLNAINNSPVHSVSFNLPIHHRDKDSSTWRRNPRSRSTYARQHAENSHQKRTRRAKPLTEAQVKRGVLDGTIPSAISDTGATSSAGLIGDPYIPTGVKSKKLFHMPNGTTAPASNVCKLQHNLRDPARTVDMVPGLVDASLLSTSKLATAGYITVYDGNEVNVYDGTTTKIVVSEEAVLKGWRCPKSTLWRIPLTAQVRNLNTDTLLLDSPDGQHSLNSLYEVPQTATLLKHISVFMNNSLPNKETINHVYELPSIEPAIRYLHGAAGFPTKRTWLQAIRKGNYLSWPLVSVKNVNKFFPESEETQKGHMRGQRQGVRSTKPATEKEDEQVNIQPRQHDIVISIHDMTHTLYTDQTGKFPRTSSRGNKYQMILHEIDSNSTWVEPMKNRTEGELIIAR